ncbi:MAG: RluA family pseudouridine synthase [Planctomycetes bacterium]|nr:RluA family pseudouridine synthase [Planctomycetota bacterium]
MHGPDDLILQSRIPASAEGHLLLDFLCSRFPYHARPRWVAEIEAGRLFVDERAATATTRLRGGAQLAYHKHHVEPFVDRDVRVLHEAAALLAVHKPAHLPMHADGPFVRNTLVHILRQQFGQDLHPVHRLDRETSGLVILARTLPARQHLQAQFAAGSVRKVYHAVVRGRVAADFVVDLPIGHATQSRITLRRLAGPGAREARPATTRFQVLQHGRQHTLLACLPATGRTHQIRAHLEAAGHPLLGDKLYGRPDDDYLAFIARVKTGGDARAVPPGEPDRQLLHAAELTFVHPDDGNLRTFTAPTPDEFVAWLDRD